MVALDISGAGVNIGKNQNKPLKGDSERSNLTSKKSVTDQSMDIEGEAKSSEQQQTNKIDGDAKNFIGGPSSWYVSFCPKLYDIASDNLLLVTSDYIILLYWPHSHSSRRKEGWMGGLGGGERPFFFFFNSNLIFLSFSFCSSSGTLTLQVLIQIS